MYESPLSVITKRMVKEISQSFDDMVLQEVINVGVNVDRAELTKALSYDRDQYNKGYEDGMADARRWISVEDRLPEEEKEVLAYLGNSLGKVIVVAFRRHGDWYFDGWKCPTVTHWMPLPKTPKEG